MKKREYNWVGKKYIAKGYKGFIRSWVAISAQISDLHKLVISEDATNPINTVQEKYILLFWNIVHPNICPSENLHANLAELL